MHLWSQIDVVPKSECITFAVRDFYKQNSYTLSRELVSSV